MRLPRRPRIDTDQVADRWQPRLYVRLVVLGLLVAYAIAFVLENRTQIEIHFVLATARVSLVWLILLALGVGLLGGILLAQLERRRRRRSHERTEPSDTV
ncbi:MAG TPA: lipopolysaccharide assembly protein LapA domain-containing protein [Gaiellaceae bacterium]|nr:lipopolysaccharide assembly protein LapA domain-containing protein [Gaiellaceae bacterium]